jgi:flavin reductase (DIM6/NTAB) family NADH-FMN oxidoreductase RutF
MADSTKDPVLGRAIGRIPSGVYILTVSHAGRSTAALMSWVQQAAFEPLSVSVAFAKDRLALELVREARAFALSILPQDDKVLMKKYARGIKPDEDPFAGIGTAQTPAGQTYLTDAVAWLDCSLTQVFDFGGDHVLAIARVSAGQIIRDTAPFTHVRGSGYHY